MCIKTQRYYIAKEKSVSLYIEKIFTIFGKNSLFLRGVDVSLWSETPSEMHVEPVNSHTSCRVGKMLSSDTMLVLRYAHSSQQNLTLIWLKILKKLKFHNFLLEIAKKKRKIILCIKMTRKNEYMN